MSDDEYYQYVKMMGGGAIGIVSAGQKMKGAYKYEDRIRYQKYRFDRKD